MVEGPYKRVNVMIREDQYLRLSESGLNLSGLIRDLLGDYLSENVVNIQVSEETRQIYDLVVSNTGSSDEEIEVHLRTALARVLEQKIDEMQKIHKQLVSEAAERGE